jgi:hypothetical protein
MNQALTGGRLEPMPVPQKHSGITTSPWDEVTLILIEVQIFKVLILNSFRASNILHLYLPGLIPN